MSVSVRAEVKACASVSAHNDELLGEDEATYTYSKSFNTQLRYY